MKCISLEFTNALEYVTWLQELASAQMATQPDAQFPSIQSFFSTSNPDVREVSSPESQLIGDGFTAEEVDAVLYPTVSKNWCPEQSYDEFEIASLVPGPRCVMFQGRVGNVYDQVVLSKKPRAAKGCLKVVIKDVTGAIAVSLLTSIVLRNVPVDALHL